MAMLSYNPFEWLSMMVRGGTDYINDFKENRVAHNTAFEGGSTRSKYWTSMGTSYENNFDFLVTAKKDFSDLNASASVGGNLMQQGGRSLSHYGTDLTLPDLYTIGNAKTQSPGQGYSEKEVQSLYYMAQFGYKSAAFLDITGRWDWASTLPKANMRYFYPSVTASIVVNELFNIESEILSFAKVRASWAEAGNSLSPYQLEYTYNIGAALHNTQYGYKPWIRPNFDMKAETTTSWEVGTDLRFFGNRIGLDFAYYYTYTVDQLFAIPVERATGYTNAWINGGQVDNKGIEILINAIPLKIGAFEWETSINLARNTSEIVELHPRVPVLGLNGASTVKVEARVGNPYGDIIGSMYKRSPDGQIIVGNDGLPKYAENADGTTDFIIGNFNPDYSWGWTNSFRYKNIELSAMIDAQVGGEVFSLTNVIMTREGNSPKTLEGREAWEESERQRIAAGYRPNEWFPTGGYLPDAVYEVFDTEGNVTGYKDAYRLVAPENYWRSISADDKIIAEEYLYDASYILLKEVRISYSVPTRILEKLPIRSLTVAAVGNNLFFIQQNAEGIDPRGSFTTGNGQGIEYSAIPSVRNYGFSLSISF